MNYGDLFEDRKKNGKLDDITPQYFEFKSEHEVLVGRFIDRVPIKSAKNEGTYFQYLFDTDNGKVKFQCGGVFDKDAGSLMVPDHIYALEYLGKKDSGKGNPFRTFRVSELKA